MPTYAYRCGRCGAFEHFCASIRKGGPKTRKCPSCGARCQRSYRDENVGTERDWANPVLSDSMGVQPAQVAEHRRLYPDIPITNTGELIIASASEERRIKKSLARGLGLS